MNKADFLDWKRHPVTQVVYSQLQERIQTLQAMLGDSAGVNPVQDSRYSGAIQAYKDLLLMDFEGEEETQ
jgi:hypothetical protein